MCWMCLISFAATRCRLSLKNLWKFIGNIAYQLLVASTTFGFLAEYTRENLHKILLAMCVLFVVCIPQNTSTEFKIATSKLRVKNKQTSENIYIPELGHEKET